jgi:two-component system phosphate regulon sensor histidine kinase PhoR
MRAGIRARLFGVLLALVSAVGLASVAFLEGDLRQRLEARIEEELVRYAGAARTLLETAPIALGGAIEAEIAAIDPLADRLGAALGSRVTVIGADGRVLGDSELDPNGVLRVENHGHRPEVREALIEGRGAARRHSTTVDHDLLYVALPFQRADGGGVVRVALPLAEVAEAVHRLRLSLAVAAMLGLGMALLAGGLASHFLTRSLRRIVQSAREVAEGRGVRHVPVPPEAELGGLARTLNRMSDELASVLGTLAEERDRLEAILEGLGDAVVAVDAERRVTLANEAALALLELEAPPVGRTLAETARAPTLHALVERVGPGAPVEQEFDLPGNPPRRVLARAAQTRTGGGAVLVLNDITRLRQLETLRRDFVANASHELRTPVSVIRANTETLLDGALDEGPEAARAFLEPLLRNAERLSRLVDDLLDISKLEAGKYPVHPEALDAEAAAKRALDAVADRAREKSMELRVSVPDAVAVMADARALDQILSNLLDNAVKYTPAGGHVTVRAAARGGSVRFEVADDGPGVEPQHRPRLFERFYRVDPGRSRALGGTGLGLAIVKHLALVQGGRVGMEPARPHGSVFWVELPRAVVES